MNKFQAETARVKYLYLDIVGFTKDRSVEAQSDLVVALNSYVKKALKVVAVKKDRVILIPTGDGMAIALVDVDDYDVHFLLALQILRLIAKHNRQMKDPMRQFDVRIGLNENVDNIVQDINGRRNVAGHGISLAQRIMDKADAGQILISQAVYDTLRPREKYMSNFQAFSATGKHNISFRVYQYCADEVPGLNVALPSAFATKKIDNPRVTAFVAHLIGHAMVNHKFLMAQKNDQHRDDTATVLLAFLAEDSATRFGTPSHEKPIAMTWEAGRKSFAEQYDHYGNLEFWVVTKLAERIIETELHKFAEYFENSSVGKSYWLPTKAAIRKVATEFPEVAKSYLELLPK